MSFDDDMRNRFANNTPIISDLGAGAAAAATSAKRRTAAIRGLAAIALVAVVGLGALAITSGGNDVTNVATENPEADGSPESVPETTGEEDPDDEGGVSEEISDSPDEVDQGADDDVEPTTDEDPGDDQDSDVTNDDGEADPADVEPPVSTIGDGVVFDIANVASNDTLNVRSGAGIDFDVQFVFAPDATGVVRTDTDSVFVGSSEWIEVYGSVSGSQGWVNSAFLEPAEPVDSRPCVFNTGNAPTATTFENAAGSANSDALIMSVLGTYRYGSCIRTVVQGLDGFSSTNDQADPVAALPNDMSVAVNGETILINFGPSIIGSDQAQAQFAEPGSSDPGGVTSSTFLFRPQGAAAPFSGIIYGPNTQMHAVFDNETGRIIIDIADAGEANSNVAPLLDAGGVVLTELSADGTTVNFTGYARPFEASLGVQVLADNAPIDVLWTGGFITDPSSSNGIMTTEWSAGWGIFEFSIELDAGVDIDDVVVRFDPTGGASDDPVFVDVALATFNG